MEKDKRERENPDSVWHPGLESSVASFSHIVPGNRAEQLLWAGEPGERMNRGANLGKKFLSPSDPLEVSAYLPTNVGF